MNPKRRFFQIHLSTAVVLMLAAGVLVWANVRAQVAWSEGYGVMENNIYGWPFISNEGEVVIYDLKTRTQRILCLGSWDSHQIAYNALIALVILLSVCVGGEWLIRRGKTSTKMTDDK